MIELLHIRDKISPKLIREISGVLDGMSSEEGFLLRDDQGIAILAEDKGAVPLVFGFSIPVPLTVDAGRGLLSLCKETSNQAGIDKATPGNVLLGCFDLLNELITNELAAINISKIVGGYHVQKLLNLGIDLKEQAKVNKSLASSRNIEAKFSIIQENKLIHFDGDIGPRLRLVGTS